jgi:hypothetical protein
MSTVNKREKEMARKAKAQAKRQRKLERRKVKQEKPPTNEAFSSRSWASSSYMACAESTHAS